jgi:hypothetical protein
LKVLLETGFRVSGSRVSEVQRETPPFPEGVCWKGGCFWKTCRNRLLENTDFQKMEIRNPHILEGAFQNPPSGMVGNPVPEKRGGFQKPLHKFC